MENFFYNGDFYSSIEDFIDEEEILTYSDDVEFHCEGSELKPIILFSVDWIVERVDDDCFSEEYVDREYAEMRKILTKHIDFDKINSELLKGYFPDYKNKFTITKQDIINFYNETTKI